MSTTDAPPLFSWSTCTTIDDERRHRQVRLAAAFRILASCGLDEGMAGHLTVRDPGRGDCFWVNPFGIPFGDVRVSDLVLVNDQGAVVEGARAVNQSAFAIHASIHLARPDIDAAVHSHSTYGRAWSSLGRRLDPITQDHCDFFDDHGLYGQYLGRVLDSSEGGDIAAALGTGKALILQNHGLLTVGQSIEEATWWFLRMERCCEIQLLAAAAGSPVCVNDAAARRAFAEQGTPIAGWFSAQPLFDAIIVNQPDLTN